MPLNSTAIIQASLCYRAILYNYILIYCLVLLLLLLLLLFFLWGGELHFIKGELTEVIAGNFERN